MNSILHAPITLTTFLNLNPYKLVTKIKYLSLLYFSEAAVKSKDDDTVKATPNHVHEKWQIASNSV